VALKKADGLMADKQRVILIGLDGLMPEQIDRYKDEIPELKRLLQEGFFSPAIPSAVTCTATNWPTIATGAWMGTHGCVGFNVHLPGMEIGETTPTFNSRMCQAEYFWNATERQGKRSILINYPCAFPKLLNDGVVIGGDGLMSGAWTVRGSDLISTTRKVDKRLILQPAQAWKHVPDDWEVIQEGFVDLADQKRYGWDAMGITDEGETQGVKNERRYVLVFRHDSSTKIALSRTRDAAKVLTVLQQGQWSGWIEERFGRRKCMRQYKAIELSSDGRQITLFGTMAGSLTGWGYPKGIEREIIDNAGGYIEALELSPDSCFRSGWFDGDELDAVMDVMDVQAKFIADTASYLNRTQEWDSMFIQYHAPDGINHDVLGWLEDRSPKKRQLADKLMLDTIRKLFQMVDRIRKECADDNTTVAVVSDHGGMPTKNLINIMRILEEDGLMTLNRESNGDTWAVDTRRTKAIYAGSAPGIWLNVRGREKYGCVAPGKPYEKLRQQIIDRLHRVTDPNTGEAVFDMVARGEAFESLGAWGERIPDILCFARPHYLFWDAVLGMTPQLKGLLDDKVQFFREAPEVLPLSETSHIDRIVGTLSSVHWHLPYPALPYASTRAICLLTGPGIARNTRIDRVNLVDIAPTLAHILGIDPPAQCEGRIVRQAFES
jgi:predicted AlkP superfamily phosphohydrolase/phosphomutase